MTYMNDPGFKRHIKELFGLKNRDLEDDLSANRSAFSVGIADSKYGDKTLTDFKDNLVIEPVDNGDYPKMTI